MKLLSLYSLPFLFMLASCNSKNVSGASAVIASDSIPQSVKTVVNAIVDNDSAKFAVSVSYPLERPYPLQDIESPQEMKSYYSTLVDDSLRNVVKNSQPADWSEFGWRGWSLKDGSYIWIDDKVYAVNYLSSKEKKLRNKLIREEIGSLSPELQGNWMPVMCLKQIDNTVYRIDKTETDADSLSGTPYRLAIYAKGTTLKGKPGRVMHGTKDTEGSMQNDTYTFTDNDQQVIFSQEDFDEESGSDRILVIDKKGKENFKPVKKVYWLKLLRDYSKYK